MPEFRHNRTGRVVSVPEKMASRYRNPRWAELTDEVPTGSVADLLAWAGDDPSRRSALLAAERAGKNRKGILDALS